jgi:hypothetical protein
MDLFSFFLWIWDRMIFFYTHFLILNLLWFLWTSILCFIHQQSLLFVEHVSVESSTSHQSNSGITLFTDNAGVIVNPKGEMKGKIRAKPFSLLEVGWCFEH